MKDAFTRKRNEDTSIHHELKHILFALHKLSQELDPVVQMHLER